MIGVMGYPHVLMVVSLPIFLYRITNTPITVKRQNKESVSSIYCRIIPKSKSKIMVIEITVWKKIAFTGAPFIF